jgi:hypothetical protein
MTITMYPYQTEEDYWRIRAFLRETFLLNGRQECNWQVARLDYWRCHINANLHHLPLSDCIFLWETDEGQLAGILTPDTQPVALPRSKPRWLPPLKYTYPRSSMVDAS